MCRLHAHTNKTLKVPQLFSRCLFSISSSFFIVYTKCTCFFIIPIENSILHGYWDLRSLNEQEHVIRKLSIVIMASNLYLNFSGYFKRETFAEETLCIKT